MLKRRNCEAYSIGTLIVTVYLILPRAGGRIYTKGDKIMPNNKDNKKSGSTGSMSNDPNREFEGQGKNKDFGGDQGKKAGSTPKGGGSHGSSTDDDEMNTAGGRQGQFSDQDRDKQGQWSPGSTQSSDQ